MTMIDLRILEPGENVCFPGLDAKDVIASAECDRALIVGGATVAGEAAVQLLATTEEGKTIRIHTTARIFDATAAAARGAKERWSGPRPPKGPGATYNPPPRNGGVQ